MARVDPSGSGKRGHGGYPLGRKKGSSLGVGCPKCDARAGHKCVTLRANARNYRKQVHPERRAAAGHTGAH
jgi:hypothetical protein